MKNFGGVFWGVIFVVLTLLTATGIYIAENQRGDSDTKVNQDVKGTDQDSLGNAKASGLELTLDELAKFNGEGGKACYIAISGTIYEITDSSLWKGGEHTTSGGSATCGADLTSVISSSPHGKSKLSSSKVSEIGVLKN